MRNNEINSHYEPRIDAKRDSFDILDWGSEESQKQRFVVLYDILKKQELEGCKLLDVGCGLTDLCTFLDDKDFMVNYLGVDICFPLLVEAQRRHADRAMLFADIFSNVYFNDNSLDVSYCSGIFNLNLGNNLEFIAKAIPKLVSLSKKLVVANFLHQREEYHYEHCFYYHPDQVREVIPSSVKDIQIIDNYLENDFTVVITP